jgi:Bacterial Ig-like domain
VGPRDEAPAHGPPLHVLATYPANGQGTNAAKDAALDCDSPTPDCPVPTNLAIELRFDRFLLPGGGLSAGLSVFTGEAANSVPFTADYDLIERVVVFRSAQRLQPNTLYTAEIVTSTNPARGFWAFDQAPLEEAAVPLRFSFSTGSGPVATVAAAEPSTDTCETMASGPLFSCTNCHVTQPGLETVPPSKYPPMGLDLSSTSGFVYTAIEHVAHQTATGNTALNAGLEAPSRFGVQMNVVDPGLPATSYLMYKLLEKPENFRLDGSEPSCATGYHAPVSDGNCQPPSDDELMQMREWFVLGEAMPKNPTLTPGSAASVTSISHASLRRVAAWIGAGAACTLPP